MSELLAALSETESCLRRAITLLKAQEKKEARTTSAPPVIPGGVRFLGVVGNAIIDWLRKHDAGFEFYGHQALAAIELNEAVQRKQWKPSTPMSTDCAARLSYLREKGVLSVVSRDAGRPRYRLNYVPGMVTQNSAQIAEMVRLEVAPLVEKLRIGD